MAAHGVARGLRPLSCSPPTVLAAACCTSHACLARQVWDDQHLLNVDFSLICKKVLPGVLQGSYTVQDVNELEKQVATPATPPLPPHTTSAHIRPPTAPTTGPRPGGDHVPRRTAVGGSFSS